MRLSSKILVLSLALSSNACDGSGSASQSSGGAGEAASGGAGGAGAVSLLAFSRTTGYRHASIEPAVEALRDLAEERDWRIAHSEDPATFSDAGLAAYEVVVFLSTTGDVLDARQQAAMERFIRNGGGYVGVHAASDTEYDWPWYGGLVGAYVKAHPAVQEATLVVEDRVHPASRHLGETWVRRDEWYGFSSNPRGEVNVVLSLDETSYSPGDGAMDGDHPIAWYHEYEGGRSFYTALGHTSESYAEPEFLEHLAGALEWAAGVR